MSYYSVFDDDIGSAVRLRNDVIDFTDATVYSLRYCSNKNSKNI